MLPQVINKQVLKELLLNKQGEQLSTMCSLEANALDKKYAEGKFVAFGEMIDLIGEF